MAGEATAQEDPDVPIHWEPRRPVEDPTLGIAVEVDRSGRPAHRLVTIGDSLTQGFMSAAVFRTDLSWPAVVAYELGLRAGEGFRYPVYEPPGGPGGLPLDLERFVRGLESRVGDRVDWYEAVRALRFVRSYMDRVEDWWERGPGNDVPQVDAPYHNLGVYGADLLDVLLLDADRIAARLEKPSSDDPFVQVVDRDNDRAWRVVLESCRAPDGTARTVLDAARAMGDEGTIDGEAGPGIETLVVMLGANHALGTVVDLDVRWTPDDYLDQPPEARLASKGPFNVWQPAHFAEEWGLLVDSLDAINARHVVVATVPAGHDRTHRQGGARQDLPLLALLPLLRSTLDRGRRLRPRPGRASDRRRGSHGRLGHRRVQRHDHRVRADGAPERTRLVPLRSRWSAGPPGHAALHRGARRTAAVVDALPAPARGDGAHPHAEHPLLPLGP